MGLFGGNFSKPGRGISKEEAERRNYFDMFTRHFWDLVKVNLLFVACNIVFIGLVVFFSVPYLMEMETVVDTLLREKNVLLPVLPFIPFLFMGPFIAGLTFVLRNWARQEHAFLVSDFFEHSRKNWKQGLALSVLSTCVTYIFITAFLFYLKSGISPLLVIVIAAILGVVLLTMNFYTYPMVVTFNMKLKDILKNAWLFSLAKLPQNLFFLIIIGAVHILLVWYLPVVWMILMAIVLIAWTGFTMNYYAWHVMNKYMISQIPVEEQEDEVVFEDVK